MAANGNLRALHDAGVSIWLDTLSRDLLDSGEFATLIRDYSVEDTEGSLAATLQALSRMPHQDVLDFGRLAELLGYDRKLNTLDFPVAPRGYRVLGRIPRIPKLVVQKIIHELGGFEEVLSASDADLEGVDDVGPTRAKDIREGLRRLREVDLVDRYLQS